jgi:hypothetical protein
MWQPGERDGESNPNSKLTAAEVREIHRLFRMACHVRK